jgi:hypothetical protein
MRSWRRSHRSSGIRCRILAPLILTFIGAFLSSSAAAQNGNYAISFSNLGASGDEVIVSLEIDVTAGAFVDILNLPVGWYITVDNDGSWQTEIKANTLVGAASLPPDKLKTLQFVIRKNEFEDLKFKVTGVVSLTKNYEKERQHKLNMSDFVINPSAQ